MYDVYESVCSTPFLLATLNPTHCFGEPEAAQVDAVLYFDHHHHHHHHVFSLFLSLTSNALYLNPTESNNLPAPPPRLFLISACLILALPLC